MRCSNQARFRRQVRFLQHQFLQNGNIPFTDVLSADVVSQALAAAGVVWKDRVYTPLVTLWIFLGPFPLGATSRFARDLSASGDTIVGHYRAGIETPTIAFHWDGTTLTEVLTSGVASGVSADGSVVVGTQLFNPEGNT